MKTMTKKQAETRKRNGWKVGGTVVVNPPKPLSYNFKVGEKFRVSVNGGESFVILVKAIDRDNNGVTMSVEGDNGVVISCENITGFSWVK